MGWSQKLKVARVARNLTIREAAEKMGISPAYLCDLEKGRVKDPSVFKMMRLTELYNIPFELIFDDQGGPEDRP